MFSLNPPRPSSTFVTRILTQYICLFDVFSRNNSDFGSEGCRFKSCPVHHLFAGVLKVFRQSCSNLSSRPSSKQLSQLLTRTTRRGNEREPHQGHNLPETKSVRNCLFRGTPRQEPRRRIPRQGIRPE